VQLFVEFRCFFRLDRSNLAFALIPLMVGEREFAAADFGQRLQALVVVSVLIGDVG